MRHMKISLKLIISFAIVIVMAVIVGGIGIFGMYSINVADDALYNGNYLPTVKAGDISQNLVVQRVAIRNFVIYDVNTDAAEFTSAETTLANASSEMAQLFKDYEPTIASPEDESAFNEFVKVYTNEWVPTVTRIHDLGRDNMVAEAKEALKGASAMAARLDDLTNTLQRINMEDGKKSVDGNTDLFMRMTIIEVVMLTLAVIVSFTFALYISKIISKPAVFMKDVLARIGTKGDMDFTDAEYRSIESFAENRDEIGQSVDMMLTMVRRLVKVGEILETVAAGDLTADLTLLTDRDTMGLSLQKMSVNLNNMFSEINNSTAQVATGSKQIADGAQALAQGSTEQAAAVEQLSSSISEVADKTRENADMATKASRLAETIKGNAEKGSQQMDTMMEAVKDINEASQSINKVIKVIDDIAFQTNILALNAAVEAARAGQHGKGFAVVAEEVRSLAAKSAEAAKDTGALIANSMEKAELGARIADETASSLTDIVSGINESTLIVTEIAKSSEEQSTAITQINKGIDQVAQVVQQNSATAEESAAASEEMSGQANMLEELISRFKLKDGNSRRMMSSSPKSSGKRLAMPERAVDSSGDFGKY